MEIVLLTSVVVTLFVVFGIATYREFDIMSREGYTHTKERGPRAGLVNFVGRFFDEESNKKLSPKQKELIYKAMNRTIADMESDGIYFSEDVKAELRKQREELNCEYSGLPSPKAYEN
jgi:hypothetical protein